MKSLGLLCLAFAVVNAHSIYRHTSSGHHHDEDYPSHFGKSYSSFQKYWKNKESYPEEYKHHSRYYSPLTKELSGKYFKNDKYFDVDFPRDIETEKYIKVRDIPHFLKTKSHEWVRHYPRSDSHLHEYLKTKEHLLHSILNEKYFHRYFPSELVNDVDHYLRLKDLPEYLKSEDKESYVKTFPRHVEHLEHFFSNKFYPHYYTPYRYETEKYHSYSPKYFEKYFNKYFFDKYYPESEYYGPYHPSKYYSEKYDKEYYPSKYHYGKFDFEDYEKYPSKYFFEKYGKEYSPSKYYYEKYGKEYFPSKYFLEKYGKHYSPSKYFFEKYDKDYYPGKYYSKYEKYEHLKDVKNTLEEIQDTVEDVDDKVNKVYYGSKVSFDKDYKPTYEEAVDVLFAHKDIDIAKDFNLRNLRFFYVNEEERVKLVDSDDSVSIKSYPKSSAAISIFRPEDYEDMTWYRVKDSDVTLSWHHGSPVKVHFIDYRGRHHYEILGSPFKHGEEAKFLVKFDDKYFFSFEVLENDISVLIYHDTPGFYPEKVDVAPYEKIDGDYFTINDEMKKSFSEEHYKHYNY